nr:CRISPR-associated endonuclease Cas2 [Bifidobacterium amazonense]
MTYGQRVQNGVFLASLSDYLLLRYELDDIVDLECDSLRFYSLGTKDSTRIEHVGLQRHMPVDDAMMI